LKQTFTGRELFLVGVGLEFFPFFPLGVLFGVFSPEDFGVPFI
jgi:hypothetical protein